MNELAQVLLRFREEPVAYTADISDMFSRIRIPPEDAKKHRFLWREENSQDIVVLQMDRLTFGDGPSPCLAVSTLQRTAAEYGGGSPAAREVIKDSFYVDDLADSQRQVAVANKLAADVAEILENGDFHLRKWVSNCKEFHKMEKDTATETTVLGLAWDAGKDLLFIKLPPLVEDDTMTKRNLLGRLAQLFSPLGLVAPFIIKGKIRLARLHLMGLVWDLDLEKLCEVSGMDPGDPADRKGPVITAEARAAEAKWWREWLAVIPAVNKVRFARCLRPDLGELESTELHIFTDASEEAFAAVVYTRCRYTNGKVSVVLTMAKTRVAPRKVISVAKMEIQQVKKMRFSCDRLADNVFRSWQRATPRQR